MDDEQRSFIEVFRRFLDEVVHATQREQTLTPVGQLVQEHLGARIDALPVVTEAVSGHRLVDADLALSELAGISGRLVGISHGQARHHEELPGILSHPHVPFAPAPVDFVSVPTGPTDERQVVSLGLRLFWFRDRPVAVLQRAAQPQFGQAQARLEVMTADPDVASAVIREIRDLMVRLSVLRGKVLSLTGNEYGQGRPERRSSRGRQSPLPRWCWRRGRWRPSPVT